MMPFSERLQTLIDVVGGSPYKFAERHGLTPQTVYNLLNGRNGPSVAVLEKICLANPDISAEYMLRGIGNPLTSHTLDVKAPAVDRKVLLELLFELQDNVDNFVKEKVKEYQAGSPTALY